MLRNSLSVLVCAGCLLMSNQTLGSGFKPTEQIGRFIDQDRRLDESDRQWAPNPELI